MTAVDEDTLRFYAAEAAVYTSRDRQTVHRYLETFMSMLPAGGSVLELGCGGGQDSEAMIARGFDVSPTDGTPEIAQAAEKRLGRPVPTLLFGDLDAVDQFDGIWANACLLHVPRLELADIIVRVHTALKAGGVFYASFKTGGAEGRDRFGRYYNYPSETWLKSLYSTRSWQDVSTQVRPGSGYDKEPTEWLHVTAVKDVATSVGR